jgi:hypothetical protein
MVKENNRTVTNFSTNSLALVLKYTCRVLLLNKWGRAKRWLCPVPQLRPCFCKISFTLILGFYQGFLIAL